MWLCPGTTISVSTGSFGSATLWIIIWTAATRSRLPKKLQELQLLSGAIVLHLGRMTLYDLCISCGGHCRHVLGGKITRFKHFFCALNLTWVARCFFFVLTFRHHHRFHGHLKKHNARPIVGFSQFLMKSTNSFQPWCSRHFTFKEIKSSHRLSLGFKTARRRFSSSVQMVMEPWTLQRKWSFYKAFKSLLSYIYKKKKQCWVIRQHK